MKIETTNPIIYANLVFTKEEEEHLGATMQMVDAIANFMADYNAELEFTDRYEEEQSLSEKEVEQALVVLNTLFFNNGRLAYSRAISD